MKVQLTCMGCDEQFEGEEPKMCCSGRDCGCMGLPIEPIIFDFLQHFVFCIGFVVLSLSHKTRV